jgi:methionyl-tRNA formyltransferase
MITKYSYGVQFTMEADFFGSDVRIIEQIDGFVDVKRVFVEKHALSKELLTYCLLRNVALVPVETLAELAATNSVVDCKIGISCGFGVIFRQEQIEKYQHGIMNIHPGSLPDNRGRHPISWAFVHNKWQFGVSFHMINEQIDQGLLVHSYTIKRSVLDDATDIEKKFISSLESEFPAALQNAVSGNGTVLDQGSYFPPIGTSLKALKASEHEAGYLLNVIRSQAPHGGVDFGLGKNITQGYVRANEDELGYMKIVSADNVVLLVK